MQTEFTELDNYININEPKLILLGGIKGVGKTTFLANIAANLSLHQNIPILFFSLEEDYIRPDMKELSYSEFTKQIKDLPNNFCLSDKIILKESSITTDELRMIRSPYLGEISNENLYFELYYTINYLKQSKLFVRDKMPITINEIIKYVSEYVKKENIKFVILDNIKLIQYEKDEMFDKQDEIKHSLEILKQLCTIFNITILVTDDFDIDIFKLSDFLKKEYIKIVDTFMIMDREYNNIYNVDEIIKIYILTHDTLEANEVELVYNDYKFQYLNIDNKLFKIEKEEFEKRKRKLFDVIKKNNVIFLNPSEFDIYKITNIIKKEFKNQSINYRVCDFFESIAIEKIISNDIEEYIETFKEIESVIFVIYTCDFPEKIEKFVYETCKKILNIGVKKKCIFVSNFYGIVTSLGPKEFGQENDDAVFF